MNTVPGASLFKMITGVSTPTPAGRPPSGAVVSAPRAQVAAVSSQASGAPAQAAVQQAAPGPASQATSGAADNAVSFRGDAPRGSYVDIQV